MRRVDEGSVADKEVTNAKLADMASGRLKGRVSAGAGSPEDLTTAQARSIIGLEIYNAVTEGGCDNTGATNTAAAVQAAMNAAAAAGKICYFPAGTYLLGGTRIRPPSNLVVFGAGMYRTTFVRDTNDTKGTIELFGVTNVTIRDLGISYTPSAYTLGYGQTGFAVRGGSTHILLERVAVAGKINRAYHLLNCSDVVVRGCHAYGSGDACLRVVSDNGANVYPEVSDEPTNFGITRRIWVEQCVFSGATTLTGTTRAGTFYGINIAGESGASNYVEDVWIRGNTVRYTNTQGISCGGKGDSIHIENNKVQFVDDGSTGNGILLQAYSGNAVQRVSCKGNKVAFCRNSIYATAASYADISGNNIFGQTAYGIYVSASTGIGLHNNTVENGTGYGIRVEGASPYCNVTGNIVVGITGTGIALENTLTYIVAVGNIARACTVANFANNAAGGTGNQISGNVS